MDMNRMTQKVNEALASSQSLAARLSHQEVDGEHLLAELLAQDNGLAPRLIEQMDISLDLLKTKVQDSLAKRPKVSGGSREADKVYITQRLQQLFAHAENEASQLQYEFISVEHLLLVFIEEGVTTEAGRLFKELGISRESFMKALEKVRGHQRVTTDSPESQYEALKKYGSDLVEMARAGKLDPVIGRDGEIRAIEFFDEATELCESEGVGAEFEAA